MTDWIYVIRGGLGLIWMGLLFWSLTAPEDDHFELLEVWKKENNLQRND